MSAVASNGDILGAKNPFNVMPSGQFSGILDKQAGGPNPFTSMMDYINQGGLLNKDFISADKLNAWFKIGSDNSLLGFNVSKSAVPDSNKAITNIPKVLGADETRSQGGGRG